MTNSKDNPLIDTGNVTVNAFNIIRDKEKQTETSITLGKDDKTTWTSPNFKVKVKAYTSTDKKTHTYFHSLSIDVNVEDFMGTAELKCPYDSDLMQYWEPIRQTVVIYGANRGDYKILFIGRVRGVKQDGYELVIEFQNYGWKFKQLVTQSYANDNVLNKDGYTIMRLMFEALKIDSYVISESAKKRLKQVGINEDGNLTLNGKELEKMPDLIKRLQESDPSKLVNKDTLNNKLREKYLHNIENINYTLKYEKPTKVMKKISSQGSYTAGSNIYSNPYGSASASSGGGDASDAVQADGSGNSKYYGGCSPPAVHNMANNCKNVPSSMWSTMQTLWAFNRRCVSSYTNAEQHIRNYANNYPNAYFEQISPCLGVLQQYCEGNVNAAANCKIIGDDIARRRQASRAVEQGVHAATSFASAVTNTISNVGNAIHSFSTGVANAIGGAVNAVGKGIANLFGW